MTNGGLASASAMASPQPHPDREPLSLRQQRLSPLLNPNIAGWSSLDTYILRPTSISPVMKVTAVLLAAISAVSVSASPSWMPGQVTINEDYKVPGDNPLYFCEDPADNILTIEKVDLSPNPPEPYVHSDQHLAVPLARFPATDSRQDKLCLRPSKT